MKQLTWKLVIPMTIISFVIFTKWWYVVAVDGPDEVLTGFPLPYMCPGWHTSLSLQIFISELIIDLLCYFGFWFVFTFLINRFVIKIRLHKVLAILLLSVSGLFLAGMIWIGADRNNIYKIQRDFDMEVLETGYKLIWQQQTRPDYYKYHPEQKPE